MNRLYSVSTGNTYLVGFHQNIPADAVAIDEQTFLEVIADPAPGKVRDHDEEGRPILIDPPMSVHSILVQEVVAEVQRALNTKAKSFGYDDIRTAVTYADEPSVPKFQQEGIAFRAWRSACWEYCHAQLDAVEKGDRDTFSAIELVSELPAFEVTYE